MSLFAYVSIAMVAALMVVFVVKLTIDMNAGVKRIKEIQRELGYEEPAK